MTIEGDRDYVLGTDEAELKRLGLQHRIWRPFLMEALLQAGVGAGSRVVDIGAGPGYVTLELAERVGPGGSVLAVEQAPRFVRHLEEECRRRELKQVRVVEADLMTWRAEPGHDVAWCRWVASFVSDPALLVRRMADSLRPGGRVILHEYGDYRSWRFHPPRERLAEFVEMVIRSWRDVGNEADIALRLPKLLEEAGFRIERMKPIVHACRPSDEMWRWPAAFLNEYPDRLARNGTVTMEWAAAVRSEFEAASSDPQSLMLTPQVLEIQAVKR
jgi:SAM-dependent methyltransferase